MNIKIKNENFVIENFNDILLLSNLIEHEYKEFYELDIKKKYMRFISEFEKKKYVVKLDKKNKLKFADTLAIKEVIVFLEKIEYNPEFLKTVLYLGYIKLSEIIILAKSSTANNYLKNILV